MSKYLVAKKFFENSNNGNLPYDAKIEYLENYSSQYINTHIIPTDNTKFELTFKAEKHSSTWSVFFGSTTSDNSPNSVLFRFYGDKDLFNVWFGLSVYAIPTFDCIYNEICTLTLKYGKCSLNNNEYEIESEPLYEPYEIYLFGGNYPNDGSNPWRPLHFKCYGFKVYESNMIIMDLIPVRKGTIGYMYDKVSGQLFENQGSENFILGPDTKIIEPEIPEENQPSKFIVGKRFVDITDFVNPNFSSIKKHFETKFQLSFDTDGGNIVESKEVILGKPYGELPIPTKALNIFIGWFTNASGGTLITSESIASLDINTLYAHWEYVEILDSESHTEYEVVTTSSYRNTGIYTASIADSSQPIYIDWGDGTVEKTTSSISLKSHTYKTNGNFTVKISDNITSADGSGEYYNDTTILPNQESLTLYAYYVAEAPIDPNRDIYLCFTAEEANSTITMPARSSAPTVYLETSPTTIFGSWSDFIVGSTIITLANVGDKVYFRAKQDNERFATSASTYNQFIMSGKITASGNLNTLLKADGSVRDLTGRNYCYSNMFNGCKSLTKAPELPATTLANYCYSNMFYDCTSLTQAPALPATTLSDSCYVNMFNGCTSLTQVPALPATTLVYLCYYGMFNGCTKLNNINVNFLAWNPSNATTNWVTSVASSGTFTCPTDLPETYGTAYMPTGWTVVRK